MSFRASEALTIAIIPILAGSYLLFQGRNYYKIAGREASTEGKIVHIYQQGKSVYYEYVFEVNGVKIRDARTTCNTPITETGCSEGGLVRVYYDPHDNSKSLLQDFGDATQGKFIVGTLMAGAGLAFLGMNYLLRITEKDSGDSDDSDDSDEGGLKENSDVLHVVPGKDSEKKPMHVRLGTVV